ncbi:MAG: hypothetical protein ABSH38_08790 [Verrucomicrobiota bacterium]|jgi:hypothetical protein
MITENQLELFRDALLRALKAAGSTGLSVSTLEIALRASGFRHFNTQELEGQLQYFGDKDFAAEVPKSHSVSNKRWRITAAGIDDLEGRGM